jgi:hypothetical protein
MRAGREGGKESRECGLGGLLGREGCKGEREGGSVGREGWKGEKTIGRNRRQCDVNLCYLKCQPEIAWLVK